MIEISQFENRNNPKVVQPEQSDQTPSITYVSGHKNPDTDSCCSAICYSYILKTINPFRNVIPITAGPISEQTQYILKKLNVTPPQVLTDISAQAKHLPNYKRLTINIHQPLSFALKLYQSTQQKQLDFACIDDENNYQGMLQLYELIPVLLRPSNENKLTGVQCSINSIILTVDALVCTKNDDIDRNQLKMFKVVVPTMSLDAFKIISQSWDEQRWRESLFIMGYNLETARFIIEKKGGLIIFTRSAAAISESIQNANDSQLLPTMKEIPSNMNLTQMEKNAENSDVKLADPSCCAHVDARYFEPLGNDPLSQMIRDNRNGDTVILKTKISVASCTMLVKQATPILCNCEKSKIYMVKESTPLKDIKERFLAQKQVHALAVVSAEGKYLNLLKRYDFENQTFIDVVLVDHNEVSQQPNGAHSIGVKISELVDHHKLSLDTDPNIKKMTTKVVGCTCTILYEMFQQKQIEITKQIGSLLLAAILSDTLVLKSPTTTEEDKVAVESLSKFTGIQYDDFGNEIFSIAKGFSGDKEAAIRQDYKIFESKLGQYGVSQVEVGNFGQIPGVLDDIKRVLMKIKKAENLYFIGCLATHVQSNSSIFMVEGPEQIISAIGYKQWENRDWCFNMPTIVSRKKQLIPHIINILSKFE